MYCKNCGKEITELQSFCKYCGTQIVQTSNQDINDDIPDNNRETNITNTINKKSKVLIFVISSILLIAISLVTFVFLNLNDNEHKTKQNENLNFISFPDSSPVYFTYNSLLEKYSGPFNTQEIQNIKADYFLKITAPVGSAAISTVEVFNSNKKEIPISDCNNCIGTFFTTKDKLFIDNSVYITKLDFSTEPACINVDSNDINLLSVKFIYMDDLKDNYTYNVNGYKYFYFANPRYASKYNMSKWQSGIHNVPEEDEKLEYTYFNADTYAEEGKVYIRNYKDEV